MILSITCKNCILIIVLLCWMPLNMDAQYSCASPHVVTSLPFSASGLTTSSGASYQASFFCGEGSNYNEQDYIFKYTPVVDAQVSIQITKTNNQDNAGIYVFNDCNQPLTSCLGQGYATRPLLRARSRPTLQPRLVL